MIIRQPVNMLFVGVHRKTRVENVWDAMVYNLLGQAIKREGVPTHQRAANT